MLRDNTRRNFTFFADKNIPIQLNRRQIASKFKEKRKKN
jgi:hypothetical protein